MSEIKLAPIEQDIWEYQLKKYLTDLGYTADDIESGTRIFKSLEGMKRWTDERIANDISPTKIITDFRSLVESNPQLDILKKFGFKSASDIVNSDVKPPDFIVDDILPIGLTVLNGAPKVGKSLLTMQLAIAVANGSSFLGHQAHKCDVMYFDLESRDHREKTRLERMLCGEPCPNNLHIVFDTKFKIADSIADDTKGFVGAIRKLHEIIPTAKLFIIDTFSRARGNADPKGRNAYDVDVDLLSPLQKLAVTENICILLVHHLKKGSDKVGDITEMSSGTMGIPGTADTNLYYQNPDKDRLDTHRLLQVRPRDAEECNINLVFSKSTLTVSVDTTPIVDVMGIPLAKWCIDNKPDGKKLVSNVIPYDVVYQQAYNCTSSPDRVGDKVREILLPVTKNLAEQHGVFVKLGARSGNARGLYLISSDELAD